MGALEAFLSTWTQARTTFGEGTPSDGAEFDRSSRLRQLQVAVESSAPGSDWTGSGSEDYAEANSRHARTLGHLAELDTRLGAEVERSAAVVAAGRRDLDAVRKWVLDAAATVPNTAAGERMLWPVVSRGASEIADIINRSNGDLAAIAQRIRGIGGEYDEFGKPKEDGGAEPLNVEGDGDEKKSVPENALDLNDIMRKKPGELGPYGYMELVPGSGVWVPDPGSPNYRPSTPQAPLDLNDIKQLRPGALGPSGYMELVPNSGTWVRDPASPTFPTRPPEAPVDLNDIVVRGPGVLGQPWEVELIPGSGVWVPDPGYGTPR